MAGKRREREERGADDGVDLPRLFTLYTRRVSLSIDVCFIMASAEGSDVVYVLLQFATSLDENLQHPRKFSHFCLMICLWEAN